ncbi:F-box domain-containing protein [Heracleum sosnowskyi]|uniref:F-box domain-containing protein n=1 Tax=Heracleum sosnowskyi TaxID=360622 RepID=A0AAD8LWQ0_9APIA|nr:F-box domain-containing protein [Heracleum sosnowskyi]
MELPTKMLDEILCRVPVKYLLRCRSVSKGWCSLIDSTPFVKKQLKQALECNAGGLIINQGGQFYLAEDFRTSFDADDVVAEEISEPLKARISGADFVGAANGLICVSKNKMKEVYIFNPSTRKLKKVPGAPAEFPRSFHMAETCLCGFGYDHLNDDYKVVKIAECYFQFRGKMAIVYSLKTNSWKRIENVPDNNTRFFGNWGMFASGALHWLAIDNPCNGSDILVGFDLGLERFKKVSCPVIDGPFVNFNTKSVVSDGGCLGILDKYPNSRIDVWVMMTDSAAEESWSKAFTVGKKHGTLGYERFVRPVYFSRSGQVVLLEVDSSKLVWYDLERKTIKNVRVRGVPNEFDSHVYTQSLVQLKEDNPPKKKKQGKPKKKHGKRRH